MSEGCSINLRSATVMKQFAGRGARTWHHRACSFERRDYVDSARAWWHLHGRPHHCKRKIVRLAHGLAVLYPALRCSVFGLLRALMESANQRPNSSSKLEAPSAWRVWPVRGCTPLRHRSISLAIVRNMVRKPLPLSRHSGHMSVLIRLATPDRRPGDACVSIGHCHRGDVLSSHFAQPRNALRLLFRLAFNPAQNRAGAVHEQRAQIEVTALGDPPEPRIVGCCERPIDSPAKPTRPSPREVRNPESRTAAGSSCAIQSFNCCSSSAISCVRYTICAGSPPAPAAPSAAAVRSIPKSSIRIARIPTPSLRRDDAELRAMRSKQIDRLRPLLQKLLPNAMHHQRFPLRLRFQRRRPHRRTLHHLADRFHIASVGLVGVHVWLHKLGRN